MGLVVWGVVLLLVGLLLTFSSLVGFIPGLPIMVIGIGLVVVGAILWLLSLPFKAAGALGRD